MVRERRYSPLEQEIRDSFQVRKRLFIGLITGSSILVCLFLVLLWAVPVVGLPSIHPVAPWIFGGVIFLLILAVAWAAPPIFSLYMLLLFFNILCASIYSAICSAFNAAPFLI